REMPAMRIWSAARSRKHANDETNGIRPWAARPAPALTMFCSAIQPSTNRSAKRSLNFSAYVEFFTSPSSTRTRGSLSPSRTSASPYAWRVAISPVGGLPATGWAARGAAERGGHLLHVVPVDDVHAPAERGEAALVGLEVVAEHRRPRLAERVHVDDRHEVLDLLVARHLRGLPHRALRHLAVAEQDEDPRVGAEHARAERQANADAEPLAERAGGDVDERQPRRGVALEIAVDLAQLHEILAVERAGRRPRRVEQRRRVAFAQHEAVARRIARRLRVEAHHVEEDRRDEVRAG